MVRDQVIMPVTEALTPERSYKNFTERKSRRQSFWTMCNLNGDYLEKLLIYSKMSRLKWSNKYIFANFEDL